MLHSNFPKLRFQGMTQVKYNDTLPTYVGQTTVEDDAKLLSILSKLTETRNPSTATRIDTSVSYQLPDNKYLTLRYLDNGIDVDISSPEIKQAGKQVLFPHFSLTYNTVSEQLHDSLRGIQQALAKKFKIDVPYNNTEVLEAAHKAIATLQVNG